MFSRLFQGSASNPKILGPEVRSGGLHPRMVRYHKRDSDQYWSIDQYWFANIENKADRSSSVSLQIGVKHFGNHGTKVINHGDLDVKLNIS